MSAPQRATPGGNLANADKTANRDRHFAAVAGRAQFEKRFTTLAAMLALRGYQIVVTDVPGQAQYLVARWDLLRELDTLAEIESFARQVGAA